MCHHLRQNLSPLNILVLKAHIVFNLSQWFLSLSRCAFNSFSVMATGWVILNRRRFENEKIIVRMTLKLQLICELYSGFGQYLLKGKIVWSQGKCHVSESVSDTTKSSVNKE